MIAGLVAALIVGAAASPERGAKPWAITVEPLSLGVLAHRGVLASDPSALPFGIGAGVFARYRLFEIGFVLDAAGSPLGGAWVHEVGGVAGVSLPMDGQQGHPRWRLEALAEVGRQTVGGIGEYFAGPAAPPAVTLPYVGCRLGVSARFGLPSRDVAAVVGVWALVHQDVGSRTTSNDTASYTVSGSALALLLRLGLEI